MAPLALQLAANLDEPAIAKLKIRLRRLRLDRIALRFLAQRRRLLSRLVGHWALCILHFTSLLSLVLVAVARPRNEHDANLGAARRNMLGEGLECQIVVGL